MSRFRGKSKYLQHTVGVRWQDEDCGTTKEAAPDDPAILPGQDSADINNMHDDRVEAWMAIAVSHVEPDGVMY